VSRKVTQLESSLGIRLLQRTTRRLSLTEPGREYFIKCSSALSEIETANQILTETQQKPSGLLRVAAPLASQSGFMCDWMTEFLLLHKDVSIKVSLSDDDTNLIEDGIDVAFRAGSLKDSSLVARKLGNTKLVLCASSNYMDQASALNSPRDLKNHDGIIFGSSQESITWRLHSGNKSEIVQVHGRVLVNSMEFALQACLAGLGIALLQLAMIGEHVKSDQLQVVLDKFSADVGGVYIIYPSKKHLSTTVRAFVDFVTLKAKERLPWEANKNSVTNT
jgi:DNA-binding transcriptional LysR family regulator